MELTIEEALQQGISAHKAGKLEEADAMIGLAFSDGIVDLGTTKSATMKSGTSMQSITFDEYTHNWRTDLNGIWFGSELH